MANSSRQTLSIIAAVACLCLAGPAVGAPSTAPDVSEIQVVGAGLKVVLSDGRVLTGDRLIGAELTIGDEAGRIIEVRIDAATLDPKDTRERRWLYHLLVKDGATGRMREFCDPGPEGLRLAFPIEGRISTEGDYGPSESRISFTCTGGALAKCVRMGCQPWRESPDGRPLLDHFRACVLMVRADYCGDGRPHTRNGTLINIYDGIGIQKPDPLPELVFEAAWGPDGAVCVHRTRIDAVATLEDIVAACPDRLAGRIGPSCDETTAASLPGALIFNDSRDTR